MSKQLIQYLLHLYQQGSNFNFLIFLKQFKEELAANVARLGKLESKVTRLEEIIVSQQNEITSNKLALNDLKSKMGKSVSFPRTCRELRASDPTVTSGMHWIDPDGQGIGDDPIYVYCDMTKGIYYIIDMETYYKSFVHFVVQVQLPSCTTANRR